MKQVMSKSILSLRDERLDSLKFVLIMLVCLGHVFQIDTSGYSEFSMVFYKLIYTFHVPLFAFISGYFTNSNKNYGKSLLSLAGIIVWGNIMWFFCSGEKLSLMSFLTPQYHLWYIMALIWWRTVIHISAKLIDKKVILFFSFLFSLIIAGMPGLGLLSISMTLTQFPFFVAGNICREKEGFVKKWGAKLDVWYSTIYYCFCYLLYIPTVW